MTKLPDSQIARSNRRGCFLILGGLIAALILLALIANGYGGKPGLRLWLDLYSWARPGR